MAKQQSKREQNALMFTKGLKCVFCKKPIANYNKTGVCSGCANSHRSEIMRYLAFNRALDEGQEDFVYPSAIE